MNRTLIRIFALLLAAALVCSFAGCTVANTISIASSTQSTSGTTDASVPEETEAPTEAPTDRPPYVPSSGFSRGTIVGSTYHSDFAGLTFSAPDGWNYYTDDEITSLLGTTATYMKYPTAFEKAAEGEMIDFFCMAPGGTSNVNLSYSKISFYFNIDASIRATVDFMVEQYEQLGVSCTVSEPVDRTVCGRTYRMVELSIGGMLTQYFYLAYRGDYWISLAGTFYGDTTVDEFEAMFS